MPRYTRPRLPGVPIFFTVELAQRGSWLLVAEVERLRQAVRDTRAERPFGIEAWVVLPDHLHCVWRLPEGDADYSVRWGAIKARFSRGVKAVGWNPTLRSPSKVAKGEAGVWQRRFWGEARPEIVPVARFQRRTGEAPAAKPITSVTRRILRRICGIAGSIR